MSRSPLPLSIFSWQLCLFSFTLQFRTARRLLLPFLAPESSAFVVGQDVVRCDGQILWLWILGEWPTLEWLSYFAVSKIGLSFDFSRRRLVALTQCRQFPRDVPEITSIRWLRGALFNLSRRQQCVLLPRIASKLSFTVLSFVEQLLVSSHSSFF